MTESAGPTEPTRPEPAEPGPKSAALIAAEPTTVLPWELVRDALAGSRMYWLATVHPAGRPHIRPVLAVWHDGALYTTPAAQARKARNLAANPHCTVTARTDNMDMVLEGTATPLTARPPRARPRTTRIGSRP